ncbi:MAG: ABC transporter permease [Acidimicrobiia bacterium]|nr:ABC transporter permease [Acidimicrobiia bacterium]MDH3463545.1 ABC transporter permease [Acidimicrobiia bacterium]
MTVLNGPIRVVESELLGYRRTWRGTAISSFVNPLLYLTAMGLGLGSLVDSGSGDLAIPYLTFIATGMMAASAMQNGAADGAFPVMAGIKWRKSFEGAISTPISPADIVVGRFLWSIVRLTFVLVVFGAIATILGAMEFVQAMKAVPPGVLTGLAFTAATTAFTVTREDDTSLSTLFRFGIIPLFLFSGTFFPISQLPDFLQPIAYVTPLFHGVELVRKFALPGLDETVITSVPTWIHITYLVAMTAIGLVLASRWLDRRLRK